MCVPRHRLWLFPPSERLSLKYSFYFYVLSLWLSADIQQPEVNSTGKNTGQVATIILLYLSISVIISVLTYSLTSLN